MKPELKAVLSTMERRLDAAAASGKQTLRVKTAKLSLMVRTINQTLAFLEEIEKQEREAAGLEPVLEKRSYHTGYREGWNACRAAVIVGIPEARRD